MSKTIMQKITLDLWVDNSVEEAVKFYTSIFKSSRSILTCSRSLMAALRLTIGSASVTRYNEDISTISTLYKSNSRPNKKWWRSTRKWRLYLHYQSSISTIRPQIHAQIDKSGGSGDGRGCGGTFNLSSHFLKSIRQISFVVEAGPEELEVRM